MPTQSEYVKLFGNRRGRPRLLDEATRAQRKAETRRRSVARNRAYAVLAHKHDVEFEKIFNNEYENLSNISFDVSLNKAKKSTKPKATVKATPHSDTE